jgi:hypothetical protein
MSIFNSYRYSHSKDKKFNELIEAGALEPIEGKKVEEPTMKNKDLPNNDMPRDNEDVNIINNIRTIKISTTNENVVIDAVEGNSTIDCDRKINDVEAYDTGFLKITQKGNSGHNINIMNGDNIIYINGGTIRINGKRVMSINTDECPDIKLSLSREHKYSINIETKSGNVSVQDLKCNDFIFNSMSGDLNAINTEAVLTDVRTISGDINMDSIRGQKTKLNTVSGDIDCLVDGSPLQYYIETNTISGDIENLQGRNNMFSAENAINANTTSGDIKVKFLKKNS